MKRYAPLFLLVLAAACPNDKKDRAAELPIDTTHLASAPTVDSAGGDLSQVSGGLPAASPDTFHEQKLPARLRERTASSAASASAPAVPEAPAPLVEAVQREQAVSRFCYVEYGKKADPNLRGNVAMLVTVGASGVTGARVADANWSGAAGSSVNRCLDDKAPHAWRLAPGAVKPGKYAVQLSFTGS